MAYRLTRVKRPDVEREAKKRFANPSQEEILHVDNKPVDFTKIDHIFADADGTIVDDGATKFSEKKIKLFRALSERGIALTVVTGKPLAEVRKLQSSLRSEVPIQFLCEKGAYLAVFDETGEHKKFILSSAELEASVAHLKQLFFDEFAPQMTKKHGVHFGLSGSGMHTSVLGVDMFASPPPENYLDLIGEVREALKITDPKRISAIEQEITSYIHSIRPEWNVVHIGGANTEIAPPAIEKDKGIMSTDAYHLARHALVLGDSWNDRAMLAMSHTYPAKISAGLVVFRETALPLANEVDFVMFGMANSDPIFEALIDARN